jgi:hypothetical protein
VGVLFAGLDSPFDYRQENLSKQYMKWVGGVQVGSDYGPQNADRSVYLSEMVPEKWPRSVTLHSLASALAPDPAKIGSMDVPPRVKTRVSLAEQMETFGTSYPGHSLHMKPDNGNYSALP